jgi:hypothetical protein
MRCFTPEILETRHLLKGMPISYWFCLNRLVPTKRHRSGVLKTYLQIVCVAGDISIFESFLRFDTLTAVFMNSFISWVAKPSIQLKINRQMSCSGCCLRRGGFSFGLFFDSEDGGDAFLRNILTFNRLHNIISQETQTFFTCLYYDLIIRKW